MSIRGLLELGNLNLFSLLKPIKRSSSGGSWLFSNRPSQERIFAELVCTVVMIDPRGVFVTSYRPGAKPSHLSVRNVVDPMFAVRRVEVDVDSSRFRREKANRDGRRVRNEKLQFCRRRTWRCLLFLILEHLWCTLRRCCKVEGRKTQTQSGSRASRTDKERFLFSSAKSRDGRMRLPFSPGLREPRLRRHAPRSDALEECMKIRGMVEMFQRGSEKLAESQPTLVIRHSRSPLSKGTNELSLL